MCEFTVYLENDGRRDQITKHVVSARLKNGIVVLLDVSGRITKVDNACIITVDTLTQELVLKN